MITKITECSTDAHEVGGKAFRLLELLEAGYRVPSFVVITIAEVMALYNSTDVLDSVLATAYAEKAHKRLMSNRYAVRSATRLEDSEHSSYAGQFKTMLNVEPEKLVEALTIVITDFHTKFPKNDGCSVIIQEYIDPDYAGVLCTRNPLSGREMVLEYREGSGEKVVGGEDVHTVRFLYEKISAVHCSFANVAELAKCGRDLEQKYNFPQDIEWASKNDRLYLLQTRPITSIARGVWEGYTYIESNTMELPRFYFEQTSLCETFPNPRPLAYSLLVKLYARGGAIERAYSHMGVQYDARTIFQTFGNELFVNKDAEVKALFPSFGYSQHESETLRFESIQGIVRTLKNRWAFSRISLHLFEKLSARLNAYLLKEYDAHAPLEARVALLMEQYATIFEITLVAQKALTKLEHMLRGDTGHIGALLSQRSTRYQDDIGRQEMLNIRGNSVNIDDVSPFVARVKDDVKHELPVATKTWWDVLPQWKKIGLTPHIERAREYMELRESGRFLSVRLVSSIRESIMKIGHTLFPHNPELIYFATIEEIIGNTIDESQCQKRKTTFELQKDLVFPTYIASFVRARTMKEGIVQVSSGEARGVIVALADIDTAEGDVIVYTDILSPDLVQYFPKIKGIISRRGGLLSHLAIMAREAHIPVVVTNNTIEIPRNAHVCIGGATGAITFEVKP